MSLTRSQMFTCSFNKHLLSTDFVPDTILAPGYKAGSQPDTVLTLPGLSSGWGRETDK